jgi:HEPN domain-containing protein
MKSRDDLVWGWLRKAESDLANARLYVAAGEALDTACFHAQQAAEKSLKGYLTRCGVQFPLIHNLEKLIELCAQHDAAFDQFRTAAQELTPFAVELRYDDEFWPPPEAAKRALEMAEQIAQFVSERAS